MYKKWMFSVAVLFLLWTGIAFGQSEENLKKVLVVSKSGVEQTWKDVVVIADFLNYGSQVSAFQAVVDGIEGIDKSKPAGFLLLSDGDSLFPIGFLPIADLEKLSFPGRAALNENLQKEGGKTTFELQNGKKLLLTEKAGWLYITANDKTSLPTGDPTLYFEGMNSKAFLSAKLFCENVSPDLMDTLFAAIRKNSVDIPSETLEQWKLLDQYADKLITVMDSISAEYVIDPKNANLDISVKLVVKPNSFIADMIAKLRNARSPFVKYYDATGAALAAIEIRYNGKEVREYNEASINSAFATMQKGIESSVEEKADRESALKILEGIKKVIITSMDRPSNASVLTLTPEPMLIFGWELSAGKQLLESLESLEKYFQKDLNKTGVEFKLNTGTFEDYQISTLVLPFTTFDSIPEFLEKKALVLLIAIRDDSILLFAGFDKQLVTDRFKKLASAPSDSAPLPDPIGYCSLKNIGLLLKNITGESSELSKEYLKTIALLQKAPEDAKMTTSSRYTDLSMEQTFSLNGSILTLIGKITSELTKQEIGEKQEAELNDADSLFK